MGTRWNIQTFRASGTGSGVHYAATTWYGSSWLTRSLLSAAGVAVLAFGLIVLIPAAVVGVVVVGVIAVRLGIGRLMRTARGPNGVLDGRRNVRVIRPVSDPAAD